MKKAPYSLQEATLLCAEFKYLEGQPFGNDKTAVIERITVTPFDEISKKRFLIFYFLFDNAETALAHEYMGLLFDILVIARSTEDQHELLQEDLATWLAANKMGEVAASLNISVAGI